jgi:hypothetical protein
MRPGSLTALALLAAFAVGCAGGSTPAAAPGVRTPPDLAAFLRHPVATPSTCPSAPAASTGLKSPWQGHVDFSVFVDPHAPSAPRVNRELTRSRIVEKVYFESSREAYAEFQRLYTCWADVSRSQTPASYRVVLLPTASIRQRNALVTRLVSRHGVDSVSCDPALPCTDIVKSAPAQRR